MKNRVFSFTYTILYSMEFLSTTGRIIWNNNVLQRKWERNKGNGKFFFFLLHISHAISCCDVKVTDLYIGWSKEMMNTTTELLTYCTVQCIFELSCVMLKWLKGKPAVSYPLCISLNSPTQKLSLVRKRELLISTHVAKINSSKVKVGKMNNKNSN